METVRIRQLSYLTLAVTLGLGLTACNRNAQVEQTVASVEPQEVVLPPKIGVSVDPLRPTFRPPNTSAAAASNGQSFAPISVQPVTVSPISVSPITSTTSVVTSTPVSTSSSVSGISVLAPSGRPFITREVIQTTPVQTAVQPVVQQVQNVGTTVSGNTGAGSGIVPLPAALQPQNASAGTPPSLPPLR